MSAIILPPPQGSGGFVRLVLWTVALGFIAATLLGGQS